MGLIKTAFQLTVIGAVAITAMAYLTKPDKKSVDICDAECRAKELANTISDGHRQYHNYTKGKTGNRSSYLKHTGATKGDDYRNCIGQKYYANSGWYNDFQQDFDEIQFCGGHAEIGDHRYIDGDRYSIWQRKQGYPLTYKERVAKNKASIEALISENSNPTRYIGTYEIYLQN